MIITFSGIAGFLLLGANYALYGVAPSYYPSAMRGTGSGASVAVGRVGSILGPLAAVMLSGGQSAMNVVQYMAPVAAVAGIAVCALSFFPASRLPGDSRPKSIRSFATSKALETWMRSAPRQASPSCGSRFTRRTRVCAR